jgi:hypothetical protein
MYGNPEDILSAKQSREARQRRQRQEAIADIAAAQKLRPSPKPVERKPHKALDDFLAEEEAPKQRSEAWQRAERLFK